MCIEQKKIKKKLNSYNLIDFYLSLSRFLFCYPDPDPRFLKWIRILPNDTDPSGSETLPPSLNGNFRYKVDFFWPPFPGHYTSVGPL